MSANIQAVMLLVSKALPVIDSVDEFYKSCGRVTALDLDDDLVLAYADGVLSGIVRLCYEQGHYTMRTMQVRPEIQGRGLGKLILEKFADLVAEKGIKAVYCMPYDHLEHFYGLIGFKKIDEASAPEFLRSRAEDFLSINQHQKVILMRLDRSP